MCFHLKKKIAFFVFLFFLSINFVTTGGHFDSFDGNFYYLVTENMFLNHSIKLDPNSPSVEKLDFDNNIKQYIQVWVPKAYNDYLNGIKNPFYVTGGTFGPVLALPWYALASILKLEPTQFVPFFTNSVILSLTSLVLFLLSRNIFSSQKIGFVIAIIFSLTSFVWPYNSSFFLQPGEALSLIVSFYFLILAEKSRPKMYYAFSGLCLGLSMMIHPSSVILFPGFLAYAVLKSKVGKKLLCYFLTFSVTVGIQLIINFYKYDSFTNFGYGGFENSSTHTSLLGIAGLVFSPGWGLIFYFPLAILLPLALYKIYKHDKKFFMLVSYSFAVVLFFFGTQPTPFWSGFGCWGPRYFIPFLPFASLSLGYLLQNVSRNSIMKFSFIILGSIGFFVNLLGSLVWYMIGYVYGWGAERLLSRPNSFDYFAWVPQYSPIIEHLKVLAANYGSLIPNPITRKADCSIDIFLYCTGNIIPLALLLVGITILAIVILKMLRIENKIGQIT